MQWWSIAWFVAVAVAFALFGWTNQAIAMACFAAGILVLGLRDRLNFLPSNRARDRRTLIVFAAFFAVLLAVPLVAEAIRAL